MIRKLLCKLGIHQGEFTKTFILYRKAFTCSHCNFEVKGPSLVP